MEYAPPLGYLIRQSVNCFVTLCIIFTLLILLVRFYEIVLIGNKAGYPSESIFLSLYGIRFDLMLALRFSAFVLVPYLLIDFFSPSTAKVIFAVSSVLVVLSEVILLQYFAVTKVPLGSDILNHSVAEIRQIINASGELNFLNIFVLVIFLLITIFSFFRWSDKIFSPNVVFLVICLVVLSVLPFNSFNPDRVDFRNDFRKNVSANKLNVFVSSLVIHKFGDNRVYRFISNTADKTGKETSPR